MLRAVVLTQYRHVTDGQTDRQTDGNAIASTALAMWALQCTVKTQKTAKSQELEIGQREFRDLTKSQRRSRKYTDPRKLNFSNWTRLMFNGIPILLKPVT